MKLNVNELKNELLNCEMSFVDLDNFMMDNGYYSIFDDNVTEQVKSSRSVVYTATDTNEAEIVISFDITIDNAEDEAETAFELKVTDIEEF